MTDRELLEQRRDQALRDIVDLERQVDDGEIPDQVAEELRRRYEATAAAALDVLDSASEPELVPDRPSRSRRVVYLAAAAVAVAAAVLLPGYVSTRPAGGAVSGNEVLAPDTSVTTPAAPDLSGMSDADLEAAVAENPTAIGTRLALAERYVAAGEYDKATDHYAVALQQDPGNPEVLGGAGWLLFKLGKVADAVRFVDQALAVSPDEPDVLWYKANIVLDGVGDTAGGRDLLRRLTERDDLPAGLRPQVDRRLAEVGDR